MKLQDDKSDPCIVGCAFMADGQLVLTDCNNYNVKVLSSLLEVKSGLTLKHFPWGVAVINNSQVIITLPGSMILQFIQIVPSLQAGKTIQLDRKCYGVSIVEDCIYVVCHDSPENGEVRTLNIYGGLIRKIRTDFIGPSHIAVGAVTKDVFISGWNTSTLACLNSEGGNVYTIKVENMKRPRHIIVDDEDNVLVSAEKSYNIHTVTAGGKPHSLLFSSSESRELCALAYRRSDDLLVVGCRKGNTLIILKLDKVK